MPSSSAARSGAGFAYIGLIILLAILALVGAASVKLGSLLQRRSAELALLEIGAQFSDALQSYAAATPPGQPRQPPALADLLNDPRFPVPRHHLRQIYPDPITGSTDWGIVFQANGAGVIALYSQSTLQPLKQANFAARFQNLTAQSSYQSWQFSLAQGRSGSMAAATALPLSARSLTSPMSLLGSQEGDAEALSIAPPAQAPARKLTNPLDLL